ncbi:MAG: hypothetical protein Q4F98_06380 [Lachnospiraceae bacterium]|nr:hypothetical protein [Lachnospiraceae bacterium]
MAHRFMKNRPTSYLRNLFVSVFLFLAVLGLFSYGIASVQKDIEKNEMETLQSAITRDITRCYAQEGTYPESLSYLVKHYGLTYNSEKYYIDYQPLGANLMPDVTIIQKGGKHSWVFDILKNI